MNMQIVRIADAGVPNKERIHISVIRETTLSFFIVMKTTKGPMTLESHVGREGVSSGSQPSFWFPTIQVKAGDQVVLYTSGGTDSAKKTQAGPTNHFIHWGVGETLFNGPSDCVVLFEIANWDTTYQQ